MTCAKVLASLAMLAGVLSFVPLQAETFVQDGATFEYTVANDEVTITAVPAAAGRLAFPSEIDGLPVRTIAENAVKGNVDIQDVFVPDAKGTGFAVAKTTKPVQDKTTKAWIYAGENDAGLSLAFKQATGIFSGSFTCWYDYVSARDYLKDTETLAHTSKTVKFEGISVQGDPALRGFGLWEATGSYEDEKTGKEKTYKVVESYPVVFE